MKKFVRKIINCLLHYGGTVKHKFWVAWYLFKFSMSLWKRAIVHDFSKFTKTESEGFIKVIHKLKDSTYGSDEYRESLRSIKPSIDNHYKMNKHHPEHYRVNDVDIGVYGMDLVDFIEMWCDWQSAVRRHKDGNLENSINSNKDRFKLSPQVVNILNNQWMNHG